MGRRCEQNAGAASGEGVGWEGGQGQGQGQVREQRKATPAARTTPLRLRKGEVERQWRGAIGEGCIMLVDSELR